MSHDSDLMHNPQVIIYSMHLYRITVKKIYLNHLILNII
jgi:hypothetical protein